jgi:hypothetical protein
MEYGTKHEIDGVATMVSGIIPALFPTLDYYEEGCVRMALNENSSFFVVSPDGMFSDAYIQQGTNLDALDVHVSNKKFSSLVLEFETIENPHKHTQIDEKNKSTT